MREDINLTAQQLKLQDGRSLGYAEFGLAQGYPVLYFHGWPGSRLEAAMLARAATDLNIRLIAVDRPGYGLSDFQPRRNLLDWPADILELADGLGINQFAILGVSGGGPYGLACAHQIPDRISRVAIACGLGPMDSADTTCGMLPQNRLMFCFSRYLPWLAQILYRQAAHKLQHRPSTLLSPALLASMPEPDRAALTRLDFNQTLINATLEAFRTGVQGAVWDGRLYTQPWGFNLQDIIAPVDLWQGELDVQVPAHMGRRQAAALPTCRAFFLEQEGHLSLPLNRGRDILQALHSSSQQSGQTSLTWTSSVHY